MSAAVALCRPRYDEIGPDWDRTGDPVPATIRYVLASNPRCGSTALCDGLIRAGAGIPAEYTDPTHHHTLSTRWRTPGWDEYLETLIGRRTTEAGVFGLKLHWHAARDLVRREGRALTPGFLAEVDAVAETIERSFAPTHFVWIRRRDQIGQAVSWYLAEASGAWRAYAATPRATHDAVPYAFAPILRRYRSLQIQEHRWGRLFARRGIEPHVVWFEEIAGAFESAVAGVLGHLGLQTPGGIRPGLVRQRTSRRSELAERFAAELAARFGPSAGAG